MAGRRAKRRLARPISRKSERRIPRPGDEAHPLKSRAQQDEAQFEEFLKSYPFGQLLGGVRGRVASSRKTNIRAYLDAIQDNEYLVTAMLRVIDGFMFAEWEVIDESSDKPLTDPLHPLIKLLRQPNPYEDDEQQRERIAIHMSAAGNGFLLEQMMSGTNEFNPTAVPTELWVMQPEYVTIHPDPVHFIRAYEFRAGTSSKEYPPSRVHHFKYAHPRDPYWGMGKIAAAPRLYNVDTQMAEFVWRFLLNDATPGGLLTTEGTLTEESRKRIIATWKEQHKGNKRAGELGILWGGLKFQAMQSTPDQLGYTANREMNRKAIGGLWGAMPILMGQVEGDVARANADAQEYVFAKYMLTPMLKRAQRVYANICRKFGQYRYNFKALVFEDIQQKATVTQTYFGMGIFSPNEIRVREGLEPIDTPEMNDHYIASNYMPIGLAGTPLGGPGGFGAGQTAEDPAAGNPNQDPQPAPAPDEKQRIRHVRLNRRSQLRIVRFMEAQQRIMVWPLVRRLERFFIDEGRRLRLRLEREAEGRSMIDRFLKQTEDHGFSFEFKDAFGVDEGDGQYTNIIRSFFVPGLQDTFEAQAEFFGIREVERFGFGPGSPPFQIRVQRLANDITQTVATTRKKVAEHVAEGMRAGYSSTQIARGVPDDDFPGIEDMFQQFARPRAQLIARTESSRVVQQASDYLYRQMGIVETVDIVGCEDNVIMPGQQYGCNSRDIPLNELGNIKFHPNHRGQPVPGKLKRGAVGTEQQANLLVRSLEARILTALDPTDYDLRQTRVFKLFADTPRPAEGICC